jgi:hypothetical protein
VLAPYVAEALVRAAARYPDAAIGNAIAVLFLVRNAFGCLYGPTRLPYIYFIRKDIYGPTRLAYTYFMMSPILWADVVRLLHPGLSGWHAKDFVARDPPAFVHSDFIGQHLPPDLLPASVGNRIHRSGVGGSGFGA